MYDSMNCEFEYSFELLNVCIFWSLALAIDEMIWDKDCGRLIRRLVIWVLINKVA